MCMYKPVLGITYVFFLTIYISMVRIMRAGSYSLKGDGELGLNLIEAF